MPNPNRNPDCDSDKCGFSAGEVRLYPGGDALVLCQKCWAHESMRRKYGGMRRLKWDQGTRIPDAKRVTGKRVVK
jgi:hypothetical protein